MAQCNSLVVSVLSYKCAKILGENFNEVEVGWGCAIVLIERGVGTKDIQPWEGNKKGNFRENIIHEDRGKGSSSIRVENVKGIVVTKGLFIRYITK